METEAISIPAAGAAYLGEPAAQPVAEHSAAQAMADQSQICTGAAQSGETAPETCKVDEEIRPDHYYGDTKIPVFKPVSWSKLARLTFRQWNNFDPSKILWIRSTLMA